MKLLFLIFHGFDEANGISKKIRYQTKALRECGADVRMCYYQITDDGNRRWMVNDEVIADLGSGKMAKAKKRFFFRPTLRSDSDARLILHCLHSSVTVIPFSAHNAAILLYNSDIKSPVHL